VKQKRGSNSVGSTSKIALGLPGLKQPFPPLRSETQPNFGLLIHSRKAWLRVIISRVLNFLKFSGVQLPIKTLHEAISNNSIHQVSARNEFMGGLKNLKNIFWGGNNP
jgi:hypothetical protein